MLQLSKFVEARNVRKIQLRISELDSPLPNVQPLDKKRKLHTTKGKDVAHSGLQPRTLKYQNVAKTSSTHTDADEDENTSSSEEDKSSMSAVEKYVHQAKKNVDSQKAKLEDQKSKRNEIIQKLEAARLLTGEPNAKVCGNCHLRLGHTQKKCTFKQCTDVFNCGQEKRHPGKINKRRLDQDITKQEKAVYEAEEELKRRESAVKTVQKSKTKQVESCLLDTCKSDYINQSGNLNWNQIRKDSLLIENYCKKFMNGRIPGKDAISDILKKAREEYEGKCGQAVRRAKRKGNPAKKTLQEHGIIFPCTSQMDSEFSESDGEEFCGKPEPKVTKQSDIARSTPANTDEEKTQLELAIQASLHSNTETDNIVQADDTVNTGPVQMARPTAMAMIPYNYFNPHLEYYRQPFQFSGPYTGTNFVEQEVNNVYSYGYGQYTQPATSLSVVDSTHDTEKTGAVSTVPNDSSTGFEESSHIVGRDDESAAMALLTLKKP